MPMGAGRVEDCAGPRRWALLAAGKGPTMDPTYTDRLRQLAINDGRIGGSSEALLTDPRELDSKSLALVRLAGLVAVGGAVPSFGAQTDAAIAAGASADEIVDVLVGLI